MFLLLNVFLLEKTKNLVDRDINFSGSPEMVSAIAQPSGKWSVAVRIQMGAYDYYVLAKNHQYHCASFIAA